MDYKIEKVGPNGQQHEEMTDNAEISFVNNFMLTAGREEGSYRLGQDILAHVLRRAVPRIDNPAFKNLPLTDAAIDEISRTGEGKIEIVFTTKHKNDQGQQYTVRTVLEPHEYEQLRRLIAVEINTQLNSLRAALLQEAERSTIPKLFRNSEMAFNMQDLQSMSADRLLTKIFNTVGGDDEQSNITNAKELRQVIREAGAKIYRGCGETRLDDRSIKYIFNAIKFLRKNRGFFGTEN